MSPIRKKVVDAKTYISYAVPTFFMILTTADFVDDGKMAKELLAALLVICMGAIGLKVDTLIEQVGGSINPPAEPQQAETDRIESQEQ